MKHVRNTPGVDVGVCGARGDIAFAVRPRLATCPDCKARLAAAIESKRMPPSGWKRR